MFSKITKQLRNKGAAIRAGSSQSFGAELIPAGATRVRLTIDRSEILNDADHDFVKFRLEIAPHGIVFSEHMEGGVGGGRHNIAGQTEDAFIETVLPGGSLRMIRYRVSTTKDADVGLKVEYF